MSKRCTVTARLVGLSALFAMLIGLGAPGVASAGGLPIVDLSSDPWFSGWSADNGPGYMPLNTGSSDICEAGRIECVDRVARRLERQVTDLGCNHNAVFSFAYARTTQRVAAVQRGNPAFFADSAWLNHYDAVFADFYFTSWNAWQRSGSAPPAWRIAFDAADHRRASAAGNLLLGMSAHVNRDLPFTLYAIGLVAPDGSSRKPDHDRVNRILQQLVSPLIDEIAKRYDPSVRVAVPGLPFAGDTLSAQLFQALRAWREQAWDNAKLLASARTAADRTVIAAEIERAAAAEATALLTLTRYVPPLSTSAKRDAYCGAP